MLCSIVVVERDWVHGARRGRNHLGGVANATAKCRCIVIRRNDIVHREESYTGRRMGDKRMTLRSLKRRVAMLERPLDNETRPFNGIVGVIGEPNGVDATLVT